MSNQHNAIERAWAEYHGPIITEGEEDYFPALPPLFKRGWQAAMDACPPPPFSASWLSIETPPDRAGTFILGNTSSGEVGQARWMPRKGEWKFPSAAMAFRADVWTSFPVPNNAIGEAQPPAKNL